MAQQPPPHRFPMRPDSRGQNPYSVPVEQQQQPNFGASLRPSSSDNSAYNFGGQQSNYANFAAYSAVPSAAPMNTSGGNGMANSLSGGYWNVHQAQNPLPAALPTATHSFAVPPAASHEFNPHSQAQATPMYGAPRPPSSSFTSPSGGAAGVAGHGAAPTQSGFSNFFGDTQQMLAQQMFSHMSSQFLPKYGENFLRENRGQFHEFLKKPKYYFDVNNAFVLRKLFLILFPFANKTWQRRQAMDSSHFEGANSGNIHLSPREDTNAPDLYIPLMALVTYVLLVGFISGTKGEFTPDKMASTASLAIGVVTIEVLLVRLSLYLISARSSAWFDFIALRGYKFVGLVVSLVLGWMHKQLYYPALLYTATSMAIFLVRTYRRGLIFTEHSAAGLASSDEMKRNYCLLFIAVLQYPLFWILSVKP